MQKGMENDMCLKEAYYKRDLLQCQKRPTAVSKETYCNADGHGG